MKKIKLIHASLLLAPLVLSISLNAGTYDETYSVFQDTNKTQKMNDNTFMNGNFEEIIRFDAIEFDDDTIKKKSKKILDEAISKIKSYKDTKKPIKVSIIGYSSEATDDANEKTIDSNTYANHIENWFRYSEDTNSTLKRSKEYAQTIYKKMLNQKIDKELLVTEYRGGLDAAYTDDDSASRNLSNRVMIAIYVIKPEDIDSDKDGVFNQYDKCAKTPIGVKVDINGCPVDSDKDGVFDYKDKCSDTPVGIPVDIDGCPLDNDKDGIADYQDSCLGTAPGLVVDPTGCALTQSLDLNFKKNSDKIMKYSKENVNRFAQFLKNNEAYNVEIIGHTDSIGKSGLNMILSLKRAKAVKAALVAQGVNPLRIKTTGRGELSPIQSNRTKEGRSANRRIEVKLSY